MGGAVFPIFAQPPLIPLVNEISFMKQLHVKRSRLFLVIVDDIADDRRSLDVRHRRTPLHLVAGLGMATATAPSEPAAETTESPSARVCCRALSGVGYRLR